MLLVLMHFVHALAYWLSSYQLRPVELFYKRCLLTSPMINYLC